MPAGSLSIKKRCFSWWTVERDDLSSVWPLLHQIGVHQMDDFQCSSDDRRDYVPGDGHGLLVGQGAGSAGKIVEKLSVFKEFLP